MLKILLLCVALSIFALTQVVIFSNTDAILGSRRARSLQSLPPTVYLSDPKLPKIPPVPTIEETLPEEMKEWLKAIDPTKLDEQQQQEYDNAINQHRERIKQLREEWGREDADQCYRNSSLACDILPDVSDKVPHNFISACAPAFITVGTAKSGTTSLYYYLVSHPQVAQALSGYFNKEVRYFTDHWFQGTDWYIQQFPPITPYDIIFPEDKEPRVRMMNGEASPTYFSDKEAPSRVRAVTPNAKLIVLLRNPSDRAYSEKMQLQSNNINYIVDPLEDMKYQITEFKKCMDNLNLHKNYSEPVDAFFHCYRSPPLCSTRLHSDPYVLNSLYYFQVRNWLHYFPKNQILFLKSEDMYANPQAMMDQVTKHLGLCPYKLDGIKDKIFHRHNHVYTPMSTELRTMLDEFFVEYNFMLYDEIGFDFNWENL